MCQKKYILDLLAETGMVDCKPANTPMIMNQKLYMEEEAEPLKKKGTNEWESGYVEKQETKGGGSFKC
nr:putative ribonuclease H-like domain-containing protein [Tanacetum cinerariifolium]